LSREDELEGVEVDQKLSESQKFALYKDLKGYRILCDTSYVSSKNKQQTKHFQGFNYLFFTEQKAQRDSGKCSLPTKKELSSGHLCLHTTDQSYF